MKKLLLASHNKHKCKEVRDILQGKIEVISLDDINFYDEIPETGDTFYENARQKADYVFTRTGGKYDILADDSGLEVSALGGKPGVFSARFAGEHCTSQQNIDKLLAALDGVENRSARFVTILALMTSDGTKYYEGEIRGHITEEMHGSSGFGYDPIFIPEGETLTFGELPETRKNQMSHRANALQKLLMSLGNK